MSDLSAVREIRDLPCLHPLEQLFSIVSMTFCVVECIRLLNQRSLHHVSYAEVNQQVSVRYLAVGLAVSRKDVDKASSFPMNVTCPLSFL